PSGRGTTRNGPGSARSRCRAPRWILLEPGLAVRTRRTDLRRHQSNSAQHRGGATVGTSQGATMRFALSSEQHQFADSIDELLADSDPAAANRSWSDGDHEPGLRIWQALADL